MTRYVLEDGSRVYTKAAANGGLEFTTKNSKGEVISTVVKYGREAQELATCLYFADAARFAKVYGARAGVITSDA